MPDHKPVRLIALDLDGTLFDSERKIPPRNREALRAAADAGVTIALASGRMTDCIAPTAGALGIDCPIIAYNGGLVRGRVADGRPVLFERPLQARYGAELIDYCRGRYLLNFYDDDKLYAEGGDEMRRMSEIYSTRTGAIYHFVGDMDGFAAKDPTKLIIIVEHELRERLHDEWAARWGNETTITKTDPEYLEFNNRRTDKGAGLEGLCRALGIGLDETLALGDGDNDAPMLRAAGLGVAMANASELTKASADVVMPLRSDQDAVAEAVERYVLGGR